MHINELLEQVSEDTRVRVEQAKSAYNRLIREAIRFESRLSLNGGKGDDLSEDVSVRVPIKVEVGYPEEIRRFEVPKQYEFAALLSQVRNELIQLKASAHVVTDFIGEHQDDDKMSEFVGAGICYSENEADKLLEIIDQYNLVKELFRCNKDILGCYKYTSGNEHYYYQAAATREILLYWAVIGLVAPRIGVTVEALTAVVLAHELAHAYTHLGYDIDGNRWTDAGFQHTDIQVSEGLAQYYTERVMIRLNVRIPGGMEAYSRLLEMQNEYYQAHKIWIDDIKATPESIREALLQARAMEIVSLNQFNELVYHNNAKKAR